MIQLKNLIYIKEKFKLKINLKFRRGEIISILGPNGSGKSTLLNIISGFLKVEKGYLLINNSIYNNISPSERPVSMLFQENNLFPHFTVLENIIIGLNKNLNITSLQKNEIFNVMKSINQENILNKYPCEISVGQRQIVALIRCILRNKPILLLDEPFSFVDIVSKNRMTYIIKKNCLKNKITALIVLHDLYVASKISNKILIIKRGKVKYFGKYLNKRIKEYFF
ncbi:MAG: ATP-binding cassette domain-containing protein [Enterobacteriaceae bacterium]